MQSHILKAFHHVITGSSASQRSRQITFLSLAVLGGCITFMLWLTRIVQNDLEINATDFFKVMWTANWYARIITVNFWATYVAASCFIGFETKRLKMSNRGTYIILALIIIAFGLPFFLYARECHRIRKNNDSRL
jgi:hypothetical protein